MLGSLARWLRMLGFETEYDSKADDNGLLQKSLETNSILLTRDEELYNRALAKRLEAILVRGESDDVRLGQLARSLGLSMDLNMSMARCPECGSTLREITRSEASPTVPESSLKIYDKFWRCSNVECSKTYWQGSHTHNIKRTLEEAQRIASRKQ
jgi:uncharacterized protein